VAEPKSILNFSEVNSMDSAGVGELVGVHMPVKSKGGELKFLNPTKKVHGILQITQLGRVFEIYTDDQMAIRSIPKHPTGEMAPGSAASLCQDSLETYRKANCPD
jgi:anti-anti-sigma regulatory factor